LEELDIQLQELSLEEESLLKELQLLEETVNVRP
jgi:hypothetical protein